MCGWAVGNSFCTFERNKEGKQTKTSPITAYVVWHLTLTIIFALLSFLRVTNSLLCCTQFCRRSRKTLIRPLVETILDVPLSLNIGLSSSFCTLAPLHSPLLLLLFPSPLVPLPYKSPFLPTTNWEQNLWRKKKTLPPISSYNSQPMKSSALCKGPHPRPVFARKQPVPHALPPSVPRPPPLSLPSSPLPHAFFSCFVLVVNN